MFTWLCRIMILVFTFNIVAPELAYAQQRADFAVPAPSREMPSDRITPQHYAPKVISPSAKELKDLQQKVQARTEQARTKLPLLAEQIHDYQTMDAQPDLFDSQMDLASAIALMHVMARHSAWIPLDKNDSQAKDILPFTRTYTSKEFLAVLSDPDKLDFDGIINVMDPLSERNNQADAALTTYYAASALLNSLNSIAAFNSASYYLPRIQLRALYRLKKLEKQELSLNPEKNNSSVILARNVLRALIYNIHQIYDTGNKNLAISFIRDGAVVPYQCSWLREVTIVYDKETGEPVESPNTPLPEYCNLDADQTAERAHLANRERNGAADGFAPAFSLDEELAPLISANDLVPRTIDASELYQKHFDDALNEVKKFKDSEPDTLQFAYELVAVRSLVDYLLQTGLASGNLEGFVRSLERQWEWKGTFLGIHGKNWSLGGNKAFTDDDGNLLNDTFNHPKRTELLKMFFSALEENYSNPNLSQETRQEINRFLADMFLPRKGGSEFTRVMAADTIAKISREIFKTTYGNKKNLSISDINPDQFEKKSPFSREERERVAAYLADIYEKLGGADTGKPYTKDYGMDMFQMALFQDFLANAIASLSPLVAPQMDAQHKPLSADKRTSLIYPKQSNYTSGDPRSKYETALQVLHFENDMASRIRGIVGSSTNWTNNVDAWLRGRLSNKDVYTKDWAGDGFKSLQHPFMVFNTRNKPVLIYSYNGVNQSKRVDEAMVKSWNVVKGCIEWVVFGFALEKIFKVIGTAWKLHVGNARLARAAEKATKTQKVTGRTHSFRLKNKKPSAQGRRRLNVGVAEGIETTTAETVGSAVARSAGETTVQAGEGAASAARSAAETIPHYTPKEIKAFEWWRGYEINPEFEVQLTGKVTARVEAKMVDGAPQVREVYVLKDGSVLTDTPFTPLSESTLRFSERELGLLSKASAQEGEAVVIRTGKKTVTQTGKLVYKGKKPVRAADEASARILENGFEPKSLPSDAKPLNYHVDGHQTGYRFTHEVVSPDKLDKFIYDKMQLNLNSIADRFALRNGQTFQPGNSFGDTWRLLAEKENSAIFSEYIRKHPLEYSNPVTGASLTDEEFNIAYQYLNNLKNELPNMFKNASAELRAFFQKGPVSRAEFDAFLKTPGTAEDVVKLQTKFLEAPDAYYAAYNGVMYYAFGGDMLEASVSGLLNGSIKLNFNNMGQDLLSATLREVAENSPNALTWARTWAKVAPWSLGYFEWTYLADPLISMPLIAQISNKYEKDVAQTLEPYADVVEDTPDQIPGEQPQENIFDRLQAAQAQSPFTRGQGMALIAPIYEGMLLLNLMKPISEREKATLQTNVDIERLRRTTSWRNAQQEVNQILTNWRRDYTALRQTDTEHLYTKEIDAVLKALDIFESGFQQIAQSDDGLAKKYDRYQKWAPNAIYQLTQAQGDYYHKAWRSQIQNARQSYQDALAAPGSDPLHKEINGMLTQLDKLDQNLTKMLKQGGSVETQTRAWERLQQDKDLVAANRAYTRAVTLEELKAYRHLVQSQANNYPQEANALLQELDKIEKKINQVFANQKPVEEQIKRTEELYKAPAFVQAKRAFDLKSQVAGLETELAQRRAVYQAQLDEQRQMNQQLLAQGASWLQLPANDIADLQNILEDMDALEQKRQALAASTDDLAAREQMFTQLVEDMNKFANGKETNLANKRLAREVTKKDEELSRAAREMQDIMTSPLAVEAQRQAAAGQLKLINQKREALKVAASQETPAAKNAWLLFWQENPTVLVADQETKHQWISEQIDQLKRHDESARIAEWAPADMAPLALVFSTTDEKGNKIIHPAQQELLRQRIEALTKLQGQKTLTNEECVNTWTLLQEYKENWNNPAVWPLFAAFPQAQENARKWFQAANTPGEDADPLEKQASWMYRFYTNPKTNNVLQQISTQLTGADQSRLLNDLSMLFLQAEQGIAMALNQCLADLERIWSDKSLSVEKRNEKAEALMKKTFDDANFSQVAQLFTQYNRDLIKLEGKVKQAIQEQTVEGLSELTPDETPTGSTGAY